MRSIRHFFSRWNHFSPRTGVTGSTGYRQPVDTACRPDLHASQAWRALYVAALFETDEGRMVERIAEAKRALVLRAHELFQTTGDHQQEQSAIEETLQSLHALERCTVHLCAQSD